MRSQRLDHNRKRIGEDAWKICLARHCNGKCELLYRRYKLCVNVGPVATGIHAIPPMHRKKDRIEAMQREGGRMSILAETLITQPRGNVIRSKECRKKMAFRIAVAAPDAEDLRGGTGNRLKTEIPAMLDFVADPLEAASGDINSIFRPVRQYPRSCQYLCMVPVDHARRSQELLHSESLSWWGLTLH